jgi:Na+-driven multidrug efflux pump
MRLFSTAYVITGFAIFISSFFTALNNGTVSAIISLLRTLVFQIAFVLILPLIFGNAGIWLARPLTEVASLLISIIFLIVNKKKYNY